MKRQLMLLLLLLTAFSHTWAQVIITYAGGYRGNIIDTRKIEAQKLTHLLYAFATVKNNRACLNYAKTDAVNLTRLTALRKINPRLKILLSVGGLGWSRGFSDMAFTQSGRNVFAQSCVQLLSRFNLDGIDIDWEFPGYPGEGGNIYRDEDSTNYTLMFNALRTAFNALQQKTGKSYLLTTAVDGWATHFLPHTQMNKVAQYVDYVCLMAYNFNMPQLAGGHFTYSPAGWDAAGSVNGAVQAFMQAGVPAGKLVAGAGFFPAAMQMRSSNFKDRHYLKKITFKGGLYRVNQLTGKNGYEYHWDEEGLAPYLFNPGTRIRIAYEDSASVTAKCTYILQHKLAGIMYWDYFSDAQRKLLHAICNTFNKQHKTN